MDDDPDYFWLDWVAAPLLVIVGDEIVRMNAAAETLFALPAAQVALPLPLPVAGVVGPAAAETLAMAPAAATLTLSCLIADEPHRLTLTVRTLPRPAGDRLVTVLDDGAFPANLDGEPSDGWAEKLPTIRHLLPNILNRLPVGLHIEDEGLRSVFFNDSFFRIFGYRIDEIARPEQWWPLVYPDLTYREQVQRTWFGAVAEAEAQGRDMTPLELRVVCRGGEEKVIQFHYRRVGDYHVHAYIDVSARHRLETELRRLANTDALTGLANRRRFFDVADAAMAAGGSLAVLLFDVDYFKAINDTHGHAAGDEVLAAIARRVEAEAGAGVLLARVGGEEFAALLDGPGEAARLAERLRARVAGAPVATRAGLLSVAVSLGVAWREAEDRDADAVMARADAALYAAKRGGRNRVEVAATADRGDGRSRAARSRDRAADRGPPPHPGGL